MQWNLDYFKLLLDLKTLLTEKEYNVGIYLKINEGKTSPSSVCLWDV